MTWDDYGPSGANAAASSPLAEDVSFARRSLPRDRIAFLRASALAAADMVVLDCWQALGISRNETRRVSVHVSAVSCLLHAALILLIHHRIHVSSRQSNNRKTRKNSQGTSQKT